MTLPRLASQQNLFLINGVHGGGKSALLRIALARQEFDVAVLRKYTTRPVRKDEVGTECLDSIFISRDEFAAHCQATDFLAYTNGGEYGFHLDDLRSLCAAHRNVLGILTDPSVLGRVKQALPKTNIIPIFLYADASCVDTRLSMPGQDADFRHRTARSVTVLDRFAHDPCLYRHVLLNVFGEAVFEQHVLQLLRVYNPDRTSDHN